MALSQGEAVLVKLRQGSHEAFETIFNTYYGRVFAVAYRLLGSVQEADDVTQEAFLRLYLRPLPAGREHNVAGWLMRVATNLGYNALRSQRRRQAREDGIAASSASEPDDPGAGAEVAQRVQHTLACLSERQAQILLLRQAGLSYAEIAAAIGVAKGSVGSLLARAERGFRTTYENLEKSDG